MKGSQFSVIFHHSAIIEAAECYKEWRGKGKEGSVKERGLLNGFWLTLKKGRWGRNMKGGRRVQSAVIFSYHST